MADFFLRVKFNPGTRSLQFFHQLSSQLKRTIPVFLAVKNEKRVFLMFYFIISSQPLPGSIGIESAGLKVCSS